MKTLIATLITYLSFTLFSLSLATETHDAVNGRWLVTDDQTGEKTAIVELYVESGKLYGKVAEVLIPAEYITPEYCAICSPGDADGLIGQMMIHDFSPYELGEDEDEYERDPRNAYWIDGRILDPISGDEYICELWLKADGSLQVRGFLGPLHRTQVWTRPS